MIIYTDNFVYTHSENHALDSNRDRIQNAVAWIFVIGHASPYIYFSHHIIIPLWCKTFLFWIELKVFFPAGIVAGGGVDDDGMAYRNILRDKKTNGV